MTDAPNGPTEPKVPDSFRGPLDPEHGLEDGRSPWQWKGKYPTEAKEKIDGEARLLGGYLAFFLIFSGVLAALNDAPFSFSFYAEFTISPAVLLTYFVGGLGSTTFSIKWLIHSVATGKWHVERIYWRIFVPLLGGIYALAVLGLMRGGFMGVSDAASGHTWALAFLVGYFSDGVSGLLSNVANAVFGTVEKK
jgi:hypothetical protein